MSIDSSVDSLENAVVAGKEAVAKADVAAQKYQIRDEHWSKLSRAESGFQRLLSKVDGLYKGGYKPGIEVADYQLRLLVIMGAFFMIGSTLALWYFARDK